MCACSLFVYMHSACVCVCVYACVYRWGGVVKEEKANLSQHALEPSKGQLAVQAFFNEEHALANRNSLPMRRPQVLANQTCEIQRSNGEN